MLFEVDGQSLSPGQFVPFTENAITFTFASPTYFAEEATLFESVLLGVDKGWSAAEKLPYRKYANIPPGAFEFKVRAVGASGKTSSAPASFRFEIGRPWWRTAYFNFGAVSMFALFAFMLHRIRTSQLRKRELELELSVQERTKQLHQALNDLQAANLDLEKMACLDGLTGLSNQRHSGQILDLEWRRAQRESRSIAFIMADVDHFKSFNDQYGHLAGDDCLKAIAAVFRDVVTRPGDLVARYGGEEFMILLPSTDIQGAARVAEKVRSRVEELRLPHLHSGVSPFVTISLGVFACVPGRDQSPQYALGEADRLLYLAKRKGRNCITIPDQE